MPVPNPQWAWKLRPSPLFSEVVCAHQLDALWARMITSNIDKVARGHISHRKYKKEVVIGT